MPTKIFEVEGLGSLIVAKRRGARNIRLSLDSKGRARVSLPSYLPYGAGVRFALDRRDWLNARVPPALAFRDGSQIGKSYRLKIIRRADLTKLSSRLAGQEVLVKIPLGASAAKEQEEIIKACEKALRADANKLLSLRLNDLASAHNYDFKSLQVKKIRTRWGSCTNEKRISLSIYLIQLPWLLIDYVILHELVHTVHLNHQRGFWDELTRICPNARNLRKEIRKYQPGLISS